MVSAPSPKEISSETVSWKVACCAVVKSKVPVVPDHPAEKSSESTSPEIVQPTVLPAKEASAVIVITSPSFTIGALADIVYVGGA